MTAAVVAIVCAILAFFAGAAFSRCGCECHEDDGRSDFEDEESTVERAA